MIYLSLDSFFKTFPHYLDFKVPMWSELDETEKETTLNIVVPGYSKNDFVLFVEGDTLFLNITNKDKEFKYRLYDSRFNKNLKLTEAKATYKSGILVITIPKVEQEQVKIKIG